MLRGLLAVPDRAPVLLGCIGLAGLCGVLLGAFRPALVLPLAAALVAVSWRSVPRPPRATPGGVAATAGVLVLVAVWSVLGLRRVAPYVVVNRDPGFLTLQALWLVDHAAAPVPVGDAGRAAAAAAGASAGTEAFWLQDGHLHAQGNKMLPALLAVLGWAGGERAVLSGGIVIGAVALLTVFALARRLTGPGWALVPTAALAASLPFLTFTRAAYTEPLAVALLCGGLVVAHAAWQPAGGRPRGPGARRPAAAGPGAHALAGVLVGAVGTARIDGAVALVGLVVGYVFVAVTGPGGAARRAAARAGLAALGGGSAMVALGLVDVLLLSPEYVRVHRGQLTALLSGTAVLVLAGAAVLLRPGVLPERVRAAARARRRPLAAAAAAAVLATGVLLATRPLWWHGRFTDPASGYGYAVRALQAAAAQPRDGSRSYDEQTVAWVAWYLGVPAVLLGFAGLALLAHRAVGRRDAATTVLVAVVGVAAVFPLVRVSITPDQVWAARRLLPATFPGLLLAGTATLAALAGPLGRAGRRAAPPGGGTGRGADRPERGPALRAAVRRTLAGALAVAVVAFPVTTWNPGARVVELSGRGAQAHAVCDTLAGLGVQRVVWTHSSPFRYLATLRVVCGVEVVEFLEPPTAGQLAAVRAAWGGGPVAALSFDATDYPWTMTPRTSVGGTASTTLGRTLEGVPRTVDTTWSEVWVGLVGPDGAVVPVP